MILLDGHYIGTALKQYIHERQLLAAKAAASTDPVERMLWGARTAEIDLLQAWLRKLTGNSRSL